jgi:WD40 repeat protein
LVSVGGREPGEIKVWDADSGKLLLALEMPLRVNAVAISPNGRYLAAGDDGRTIKVWVVADGKEKCTLHGHTRPVLGLAFSPDGLRLVSASADETIKVWDITTHQETLTLRGHTGAVHAVAFSPDGATLVSCGSDKTIRIWPGRGAPATGGAQRP